MHIFVVIMIFDNCDIFYKSLGIFLSKIWGLVIFQIPEYILKGRDVKVDIGKKHLKVSHKTNSGTWSEIIDDDLPWEVNKEESMWTLVPKEHVHVSFRSEIHVSIFLLPGFFFKCPPISQFVSKSTCLTCFGSIQVNTRDFSVPGT